MRILGKSRFLWKTDWCTGNYEKGIFPGNIDKPVYYMYAALGFPAKMKPLLPYEPLVQ